MTMTLVHEQYPTDILIPSTDMLQSWIGILLYCLGHKEVSHLIQGDHRGQAEQNKVWVVHQTVSQKWSKAV